MSVGILFVEAAVAIVNSLKLFKFTHHACQIFQEVLTKATGVSSDNISLLLLSYKK
jgi:hypothetical protein